MTTGLNDRQRVFAEKVVSGMAAGRAYEAAGYDARGVSADSQAARLMTNGKVIAYLADLRAAATQSAVLTLQESLEFLAEVVRTPVDLVVGKRIHEGYSKGGAPLMPSKLGALKLNAELTGLMKPQKVEITNFAEVLAALPKVGGLPTGSLESQVDCPSQK